MGKLWLPMPSLARYVHNYCRAKNNVWTTVNFRANDGKDRSNDYTSGHYDRPGEYSALNRLIGASVSESHLGSSTRPLSVCLSVYIYISYVRPFWSRGPRATRKRKPAHLKFKGHMHACCIYVANASRAITTLIERLHMYSSSLITSSAG